MNKIWVMEESQKPNRWSNVGLIFETRKAAFWCMNNTILRNKRLGDLSTRYRLVKYTKAEGYK